MGAFSQACVVASATPLLQELSASRQLLDESVDSILCAARAYAAFCSKLADDADDAQLAQSKFAETLQVVRSRVAVEPPNVQAVIVRFLDGLKLE
jgi:hypothetical protein